MTIIQSPETVHINPFLVDTAKVRRAAAPPRWRAEIHKDYRSLEPLWRRLEEEGHCTVFQTYDWVACWYDTARVQRAAEPVIITVTKGGSEPICILPLCLHRKGNLKIISFADMGLTDYAAPVLGPQAADFDLTAIVQTALDALPPCDIVHFEKIAEALGSIENPLARLKGKKPFAVNCHGISLAEPWSVRRREIMQNHMRANMRRRKKLINKEGPVAIQEHEDPAIVAPLMETLIEMRDTRFQSIGRAPMPPLWRNFYTRLMQRRNRSFRITINTLTLSDEMIAGCFGLEWRKTYYSILPTFKAGSLERLSPGLLLFDQMIENFSHKYPEGGYFDFTVGDEVYKTRFGCKAYPLYEWMKPRSLAGIPHYLLWRFKVWLRQRPQLYAAMKKVMGKK